MKKIKLIFSSIAVILSLSACKTTQSISYQKENLPIEELEKHSEIKTNEQLENIKKDDSLLLVFAGDIMAHEENFTMKADMENIWKDIKDEIKAGDFSFANLEAPVSDSLPWKTYPTFNMKTIYPDLAIEAGFNVFSLSNNHTGDQGLTGIKSTYNYFEKKEKESQNTERPVYSAGIKTTANAELTYKILKKNDWTILFVAITELMNSYKNAAYVDYIKPDAEARKQFLAQIEKLRKENPCDLFIISVHCAEAEYIRSVNKTQKDFYYALLEHGADIVWANHPHVAKDWDVIVNPESHKPDKMIMYALGNTISGQRRDPQFKKPDTARDYTGDGYIIQVRVEKESGQKQITWVNPILITTYIDSDKNYLIRKLDDVFLNTLRKEGDEKWASYLEERKNLMESTRGKLIWQ
ncbi:MAG: CapA family protein [Treponema sp.]|nr:CapA family protein [Treponema sp.]